MWNDLKRKFFIYDVLFGILLVGILVIILKMYEYIDWGTMIFIESGLITVVGVVLREKNSRKIKGGVKAMSEKKVIAKLSGKGLLICEKPQFCDKGNKKGYFIKNEYGNIVSNKCGEWCYQNQKKNCRHLRIIPTDETKISPID